MAKKTAVIIGAGPAGLTAAYELLKTTDIVPIVFEATDEIGGISKTVNYKGNRIDLGGHRFFSKSDIVMKWWQEILPIQGSNARDDIILKRKLPLSQAPNAPDPEKTDRVMLIRNRLSRIYFIRRFFDYPISLTGGTFRKLGVLRIIRIGLSYIKIRIFPIKKETSLEDFYINRFGKELYKTFFKDYTHKVWGVPCNQIKPDWGAQRVKGLSITKAILHAVKNVLKPDASIDQKKTETSLIEQFMYPKFGPGQLWEEVAAKIRAMGGTIHLKKRVVGIDWAEGKVTNVRVEDGEKSHIDDVRADYVFSTMPVKELIQAMKPAVPPEVRSVADGLLYRDFVTVGVLLKKLKITNTTKNPTINNIIPDNWIYIQEHEVKVGRLQIFNNWSPYMVNDPNTVWIGMEYFCTVGDELWKKTNEEFARFAIDELAQIDVIDKSDLLDTTVIRMPKTYPAYFGTYDRFEVIRHFTDTLSNLFLIGRNGMHKYNNADHSMLSAIVAVKNAKEGIVSKDAVWQVNTEKEYHESK
ncbi:MAG: NAD(P)/FAD-dependent oxidoreductase [Chitinivibrionales bacterium]|nr:NAD(P)/FAD-dependent oxidoreductase [Chitinivibrionales bacterium]